MDEVLGNFFFFLCQREIPLGFIPISGPFLPSI